MAEDERQPGDERQSSDERQPAGERQAEAGEAGEAGEPGAGDERRLTDEELAARIREDIKRLRVVDVAGEVMVTLVTLGYQKMGLTGETLELRHLPDARLAIELLRGLIETLEREKVGDVAAFRSTLAAMQLQYARVAPLPDGVLPGEAVEGPAGPAAGAAAGEQPPPADGAREPGETGEDASQDEAAARAAKKLWVPPGARGDQRD